MVRWKAYHMIHVRGRGGRMQIHRRTVNAGAVSVERCITSGRATANRIYMVVGVVVGVQRMCVVVSVAWESGDSASVVRHAQPDLHTWATPISPTTTSRSGLLKGLRRRPRLLFYHHFISLLLTFLPSRSLCFTSAQRLRSQRTVTPFKPTKTSA